MTVSRGGEEVMMDVGGQDATESFEVYSFHPAHLFAKEKSYMFYIHHVKNESIC